MQGPRWKLSEYFTVIASEASGVIIIPEAGVISSFRHAALCSRSGDRRNEEQALPRQIRRITQQKVSSTSSNDPGRQTGSEMQAAASDHF